MKIDVTEHGDIRLKEVFNCIVLETEEGEKISICMRDGGFEISVKDQSIKSEETYYNYYYMAKNGIIKRVAQQGQNRNYELKKISERQ